MSFLGKNIRKIRTVKGLSQSSFAEIFNITRASVGAYEEGRAEAKIDTVIEIANYFSISIDQLLTKELTINEIINFDIFREVSKTKKGSRNKKKSNSIPLVSTQIFSEYILNLKDKNYVKGLPKIILPNINKSQVIAFEHSGNEMEFNNIGIHHGDILICFATDKNIPDKIPLNKIYIIVTKNKIICRRLIKIDEYLILKADNPNFDKIKIRTDNIKELWQVTGVYSNLLISPSGIEERLLQLEKKIEYLNSKL
jgi:transcriptional regulator with XRE-family HTH domain